MEFCPRSLLCWGSQSLCCFSQGPNKNLQNWMMQKNSERSLQGNRGSNSIELSWHYCIACLNTWGFYGYKFDSRSCLKKKILICYACIFPGLLNGWYKICVHMCCIDLRPNYVVILLQSEFNEVLNFIAPFCKNYLQRGKIS